MKYRLVILLKTDDGGNCKRRESLVQLDWKGQKTERRCLSNNASGFFVCFFVVYVCVAGGGGGGGGVAGFFGGVWGFLVGFFQPHLLRLTRYCYVTRYKR